MAENTETKKKPESKNKLFREKNLERLESPEKLNDYLKVTSPSVWLVLITVIALLIGVCIWGFFGRIEATTTVAVVTENGESECLVPESALEGAVKYRTLKIDGESYELNPSVLEPQIVSESTNVYTVLAGNLSIGEVVFPIALTSPLESDGIVSGVVVTEEMTPASLFFDR